MNPYDKEQTDAVWQRVAAVSMPAAETPQETPEDKPQDTTGVDLAEMIAGEYADRMQYLTLARMACGCDAGLLRHIAQEELCHARRLGTLYYIQTGKKYCPMPVTMPCEVCLCDALRQAYQGELRGAARYQRAAEQYPEQKMLFTCLAEEEMAHSRTVMGILERHL